MNTNGQRIFQAFNTPVSQYRKHLKSLKPPKIAKASVRLRCTRTGSPEGPGAVRGSEPGAARAAAWGRRPGGRRGRSRRGATHRVLRRNFLVFSPHTLSAILGYLLQPRLGKSLFTRATRRKLLSGTAFASWFMLLSRRYFNLKKHE